MQTNTKVLRKNKILCCVRTRDKMSYVLMDRRWKRVLTATLFSHAVLAACLASISRQFYNWSQPSNTGQKIWKVKMYSYAAYAGRRKSPNHAKLKCIKPFKNCNWWHLQTACTDHLLYQTPSHICLWHEFYKWPSPLHLQVKDIERKSTHISKHNWIEDSSCNSESSKVNTERVKWMFKTFRLCVCFEFDLSMMQLIPNLPTKEQKCSGYWGMWNRPAPHLDSKKKINMTGPFRFVFD